MPVDLLHIFFLNLELALLNQFLVSFALLKSKLTPPLCLMALYPVLKINTPIPITITTARIANNAIPNCPRLETIKFVVAVEFINYPFPPTIGMWLSTHFNVLNPNIDNSSVRIKPTQVASVVNGSIGFQIPKYPPRLEKAVVASVGYPVLVGNNPIIEFKTVYESEIIAVVIMLVYFDHVILLPCNKYTAQS